MLRRFGGWGYENFGNSRKTVSLGPSVITAPVISGTVAAGQTITLDTQPVWDASAVSSSWDWIAGGVSVQTGGTTYVMQVGETDIRIRATATDADGSTSIRNSNQIIALSPPLVAASDSQSGRILTITVDALTGVPDPAVSLTTLTRDGVDVLGDQTGAGPWEYTVPSSEDDQVVAWTVTAYNGELPDDSASGSETILADVIAPPPDPNQPTVTVFELFGASNQHGGSTDMPGETRTVEDGDPNVYFANPNNPNSDGNYAIEVATFDGNHPRSGGSTSISVSPAVSMAKAYLATQPVGSIAIIRPHGFGGQGVFSGAVPNPLGPMHPDGAGPAFAIGGGSAGADVQGAIHLHAINANNFANLNARIAESFPNHVRGPSVIYGLWANENDSNSDLFEMAELSIRACTEMRTAIGEPDAAWIIPSAPPPFQFTGANAARKWGALSAYMAQATNNAAYLEGPTAPEFQHIEEAIHYRNAGFRLIGHTAAGLVTLARSRNSAPHMWVDWSDAMTNKPAEWYGFYRASSSYGSGPVLDATDGTTTVTVNFDVNGYPDWSSLSIFADTAELWIIQLYNHMGGEILTSEGAGKAMLKVAPSGGGITSFVLQGRRLAWQGEDVLFSRTVGALPSGAALFEAGRVGDAGSMTHAALDNRDLAIFTNSGKTKFFVDAMPSELDVAQASEPADITALPGGSGGYTMWCNYLDANGLRANGQAVSSSASTGTRVNEDGFLTWGGQPGRTDRYSEGWHSALGYWTTAPMGADLAILDTFAQAYSATGDTGVGAVETEDISPV